MEIILNFIGQMTDSLAWPILIFVFLIYFRREIRSLVKHVSKAQIGNVTVELDRLQDDLDKKKNIPSTSENKEAEKEIDSLLELAAKDPHLAILRLTQEIEKETRVLVFSSGHITEISGANIFQAFDFLKEKELLPQYALNSIKTFMKIRNLIVHGREVEEREVIRTLDVGMALLKMIKAIPREKNTVYKTGIDVFHDEGCTRIIEGVKAIMLRTKGSGDVDERVNIFPSTKPEYYKPGDQVSWEWSFEKIWDNAWYKGDVAGQTHLAWVSSGEFTGRDLKTLEY